MITDVQRHANTYYQRCGLPFVTLSYAQSIDGSIAAADGRPLRISGDRAMQMTHMLRAAHDAILVGVGTVLADDPRLTVRLAPGNDPQPIILDSSLRTPLTARCLQNARAPWLITTKADRESAVRLAATGVQVIGIVDPIGQVSLSALLPMLAERGSGSIMVEGGAAVLSSFLHAQLTPLRSRLRLSSVGFRALAQEQREPTPLAAFPRLVEPQLIQLGADIICYGHFCRS
ncbi:MAG: dihydrofolate reductase family protein [Caldilineaceae bacterium]